MKKMITIFSVLLCMGAVTAAHAESVTVERFTHQNIAGNQSCYSGDALNETEVTGLPDVVMGMRINNPVIRVYLKADAEKNTEIKAEQYNRFGRLLSTDTQMVSLGTESRPFEFRRVRNAESVKVYADGEYIGGLDDAVKYENGMSFTMSPSDYQIYQRNDENKTKVEIAGTLEDNSAERPEHIVIGENTVTVNFDDADDEAVVIVAEYSGDTLKRAVVKEKTEGEKTVIISSEDALSEPKVMVWDSFESMKPYEFKETEERKVMISAVNKKTGEKTEMSAVPDENGAFDAELELPAGMYDITADCGKGEKRFENVGVGDIWVAAGQSNMTDMGAITDGWNADRDDPITENMHIIFAEDTKWQQMAHPAGEGRFFKTGVRTSPVTSFARKISETENVPVGIVQSSVGGTNIFQWAKGIKPGDATDGYLFNALKCCFDNMPDTKIRGILWYQGCNDTMSDTYAYSYDKLESAIFTQMRDFFGEDTPIITTQINDANQDSTKDLGYYDAWSYVKDIQRRNPELFDNVYVVGTGALDLGDTIHNSAKSNPEVGGAWAKVALNRVYGHDEITYLHPTIESIDINDEHTLTLTFKNVGADGLYLRNDTKRLNISRSPVTIQLGDLAKEFTVRQGGARTPAASNVNKGTELTVTGAVLNEDNTDGRQTVTLTVAEEMAGTIAVDCCYGKRFVPTLTDKASGWSVLAFYNVLASWGADVPAVSEPVTYKATDTALISQGEITAAGFPSTLSADIAANTASSQYMYLNKYANGDAFPLVKFDLSGLDTAHVVSAKLRIYTNEINKERNGDISVYAADTGWTSASKYSDYASITKSAEPIKKYTGVNTSAVFPQNSYSDIDLTDHISKLNAPGETAFAVAATHVAVALMSGVDSDNAPQLVVQPGRIAEIKYSSERTPAANVNVVIAGTGQTEYSAEFKTDENGCIKAVLPEGTYKAVTAVGEYKESENRFTIGEADSSLAFELEKNDRTPSRIEISGGSAEAAPGTSTAPFTAVLYDAESIVIENGMTWAWSCDNGATVENGIVTIPADAVEDTMITVTVTATFNGQSVSKTAEIVVKDITGYTFGSSYAVIKAFDTGNASDVAAGASGIKVSTAGGNYNGVFIRNGTSVKEGYYPNDAGFAAENDAYYLFAGAGGNNDNTVVTLKLAKTIPAGKQLTIKLARPMGSNGKQRPADGSKNEVVIGSATINAAAYNYNTWHTETVTSISDVSEIKLNLGKWSAVAIESIEIGE